MNDLDRIESLEYKLLNTKRRIQIANARMYLSEYILERDNDRELADKSFFRALRILGGMLEEARSAIYELQELQREDAKA